MRVSYGQTGANNTIFFEKTEGLWPSLSTHMPHRQSHPQHSDLSLMAIPFPTLGLSAAVVWRDRKVQQITLLPLLRANVKYHSIFTRMESCTDTYIRMGIFCAGCGCHVSEREREREKNWFPFLDAIQVCAQYQAAVSRIDEPSW